MPHSPAGRRVDGELVRQARGWTLEEWDDARDRLLDRGLLDRGLPDRELPAPDDAAGARLSPAGEQLLREAEEVTDTAAAGVWPGDAHSPELAGLAAALLPIARACAGQLPSSTPIGISRTWDVAAEPDGPEPLLPA